MTRDIGLFTKACPTCAKNKKANRKAKASLQRYHAGVPFETVHIDILGHFIPSHSRKEGLLPTKLASIHEGENIIRFVFA